ncbi:beta-ketoacyl-[acyl-carrier-protein] synthase family protein [bacterium]|nr:beta-ketoacyl-[acyl-carrier-protein] synthase family protein [bacterium]
MGAISAAGANLAETLDTFQRGQVNKKPVFEHRMSTLNLALCAVDEALNDAELKKDIEHFRVGVCLGTTVASQLNDVEFYRSYRSTGEAPMDSVDRFLKGNLSQAVANTIGAKGPRVTVVNACSSGADAIGVALSWLRNGECDIAIAGGADELNRIPICGFRALGIVSESLCAPFDRGRKGLNLGEGAGILVLERETCARKRGNASGNAPRLYLAGYGASADAYHLTAPRPDGTGLEAAIQRALSESHISSQDVCFVNAHGTATHDNDKVEGMVLSRVFGKDIKVLSTKGFTGHTLGGAGGLEAVFTGAALLEGWIPASAGFVNQDDEIPITPVREKTSIHGSFALSTSLAFGGNNAAIVIGRGA